MSVRCLATVWERSTRAGSELLLMLAIADFADDAGNAYPAVKTLATKCRMTPRNVNHLLVALKACGELEVRLGEGPKGCNKYRIVLDGKGLKAASSLKSSSPLNCASPPEGSFTLKPASGTPEAGFPKPLKQASDEPSLNHQEPSPLARPTRRATEGKLPNGFTAFWNAYPRKVSKQEAAKAFARLKPDERLLAAILTAVERQAASQQWQRDGGRFIPHAATWLNGRRWEDAAETGISGVRAAVLNADEVLQ